MVKCVKLWVDVTDGWHAAANLDSEAGVSNMNLNHHEPANWIRSWHLGMICCRRRMPGEWGTPLDNRWFMLIHLRVEPFIYYGIRVLPVPHVSHGSIKMNIMVGYLGFSDSIVCLQIHLPILDPIHETPLFFQHFLYILPFVPRRFHGSVPAVWGVSYRGSPSRTKSPGRSPAHGPWKAAVICRGWGSKPGTSKACCNTTSSMSKWRPVECYTEPWMPRSRMLRPSLSERGGGHQQKTRLVFNYRWKCLLVHQYEWVIAFNDYIETGIWKN